MIELIGLSFISRQMILLGIGVLLAILLIGFGVLLFLKIRAVKEENSVESLPTLVDLGLEDGEDDLTISSPSDDDEYAFFDSDEDEEEIMQGKFLG